MTVGAPAVVPGAYGRLGRLPAGRWWHETEEVWWVVLAFGSCALCRGAWTRRELHQPPAGPQNPARLGGGCGRIGREMECVDRHGGVGAGLRKPSMGEIANNEPCPAGQPEQRRRCAA